MRELGLVARAAQLYMCTTDSKHSYKVYDNVLNRKFHVEEPNTVWATDIMYVHTGEGFVYFNPVIDLFSRKVISYRVDDHMEKSLSIRALKQALQVRKPKEGWIHNSDHGSQYVSNDYIEMLEKSEATISMSRKGDPFA